MDPITLRAARRMKDVKMEELAKLLGIRRETYGKREQNPHRFIAQDAQKICARLGVGLEDIIEFCPNNIT